MTGNNPVPSSFEGSNSGTIVTLGPGNYVVSETINETGINLLNILFSPYVVIGPQVSFGGDCTPTAMGSFSATGTIRAEESNSCHILNHFDIAFVFPG